MVETELRSAAWLICHPALDDARQMWRIARDSKVLDVNSSYAYLLWCSDFRLTSAVTRIDGETIGFVTGYVRPSGSLMIWQIAIDEKYRGQGLAIEMLRWLVATADQSMGISHTVETTVAQSNTASRKLFSKFASRYGMDLSETGGFGEELFPDTHEAEPLLRLTPITHATDLEIRGIRQ